MKTLEQIIIEERDKYPGGIDAVHVQQAARLASDIGQYVFRFPNLRDILDGMETLVMKGELERMEDLPGANLSSTRIYAKPGAYPQDTAASAAPVTPSGSPGPTAAR